MTTRKEILFRDFGYKARSNDVKNVGSSFNDVISYAYNSKTGAINLRKMEELEGRFGYNGGRGCDVTSGPCSCGAWH